MRKQHEIIASLSSSLKDCHGFLGPVRQHNLIQIRILEALLDIRDELAAQNEIESDGLDLFPDGMLEKMLYVPGQERFGGHRPPKTGGISFSGTLPQFLEWLRDPLAETARGVGTQSDATPPPRASARTVPVKCECPDCGANKKRNGK